MAVFLKLSLVMAMLLGGTRAHAQTTEVLVRYTNLWLYNESGLQPEPDWNAREFSPGPDCDVFFGLSMQAILHRTSPLPLGKAIKTVLIDHSQEPGGAMVLSWLTNAYGAKLESCTNLEDMLWFQVKDQNNPYTNFPAGPRGGPQRFYRIKMP